MPTKRESYLEVRLVWKVGNWEFWGMAVNNRKPDREVEFLISNTDLGLIRVLCEDKLTGLREVLREKPKFFDREELTTLVASYANADEARRFQTHFTDKWFQLERAWELWANWELYEVPLANNAAALKFAKDSAAMNTPLKSMEIYATQMGEKPRVIRFNPPFAANSYETYDVTREEGGVR